VSPLNGNDIFERWAMIDDAMAEVIDDQEEAFFEERIM
jgi:hypothetical protein